MGLLSGVGNFFGLDIGTKAVRLVELRGTGTQKELVRYAYTPVDSKLVLSDSKADLAKLMQAVNSLVQQAKLTTKNVAVGIPSSRVFTTVADIDRVPANELAKAISYQADSLIPTPVAESKIDWALIGDSPVDKAKVEVLLSSVPNSFVERQLDALESIGLNVIAFEPDNLALVRSLIAPETTTSQMVIDIGFKSTDLVITMDGFPRLTRAIPTGTEVLVRSAAQNLNIDETQANQFVFKFGLSRDKLEGQVFQSISSTIDLLITEIEKSIKFFQARYPKALLENIIVTGSASVLPEFPLYLANKFNMKVEIGNAWKNVSFPAGRENELLAISNQFGVAVGLAGRHE